MRKVIVALACMLLAASALGMGSAVYAHSGTDTMFRGTVEDYFLPEVIPGWAWVYRNDQLSVNWSADWERGATEGWCNPPYTHAWRDNLWNGQVPGGSGMVWHYRMVWSGITDLPGERVCSSDPAEIIQSHGANCPDGEVCDVWKQIPAGYGVRR